MITDVIGVQVSIPLSAYERTTFSFRKPKPKRSYSLPVIFTVNPGHVEDGCAMSEINACTREAS